MSLRVQSVLAGLPSDSRIGNGPFIAACIKEELEEAMARDLEVTEAEALVRAMLAAEFANVRVVEPFRIIEPLNFSKWTVTVQYPVGGPLTVTDES